MHAPQTDLSAGVDSILSVTSLDPGSPDAAGSPEAGAEEALALELEEAVLGDFELAAEDSPPSTEAAEAGTVDADFAGVVRSAVDRIGGEILFEMQLDNVPESGHVAAVSVGDGELRRFLLVVQPTDGGPLRVEPTEESANPLAALASSYAGLVDAFKKAA